MGLFGIAASAVSQSARTSPSTGAADRTAKSKKRAARRSRKRAVKRRKIDKARVKLKAKGSAKKAAVGIAMSLFAKKKAAAAKKKAPTSEVSPSRTKEPSSSKRARRTAVKERIQKIKNDKTKPREGKKREIGANRAFRKGGYAGFASYAKKLASRGKRDKK